MKKFTYCLSRIKKSKSDNSCLEPWLMAHESGPSVLMNSGHESGPRPSRLRARYDLTSGDMTLIIVLSLSVTALVKSILCDMFMGICLNLCSVWLDFWWNDVFGWWDFRKRKGFINNNLISPLNICSEFDFGFSFIKVFKVIWNQRIKTRFYPVFKVFWVVFLNNLAYGP